MSQAYLLTFTRRMPGDYQALLDKLEALQAERVTDGAFVLRTSNPGVLRQHLAAALRPGDEVASFELARPRAEWSIPVAAGRLGGGALSHSGRGGGGVLTCPERSLT